MRSRNKREGKQEKNNEDSIVIVFPFSVVISLYRIKSCIMKETFEFIISYVRPMMKLHICGDDCGCKRNFVY